MCKYEWAKGSRMKGDADAIGQICKRLDDEGRLSAKELVNEGRDESSPLHDLFEWDDTIAAEKYREVQAGKIIRSITVVMKESPIPTRAYSSISSNHYTSTSAAMSRADTRAILLKNALAELRAFKSKYATLQELAKVFEAIDETI